MQAGRYQMYNNNAFKLGLFGANCSSGRAINTLPERWTADWESCETMAKLADEIGFDFIPVDFGTVGDLVEERFKKASHGCGGRLARRCAGSMALQAR